MTGNGGAGGLAGTTGYIYLNGFDQYPIVEMFEGKIEWDRIKITYGTIQNRNDYKNIEDYQIILFGFSKVRQKKIVFIISLSTVTCKNGKHLIQSE